MSSPSAFMLFIELRDTYTNLTPATKENIKAMLSVATQMSEPSSYSVVMGKPAWSSSTKLQGANAQVLYRTAEMSGKTLTIPYDLLSLITDPGQILDFKQKLLYLSPVKINGQVFPPDHPWWKTPTLAIPASGGYRRRRTHKGRKHRKSHRKHRKSHRNNRKTRRSRN